MPSEAAQRIRATLVNDAEMIDVPIEIQRRDWEAAVAQEPLPSNTVIEPFFEAGVPCERVMCQATDPHNIMLFLHGGGFSAGSCLTHRKLAAYLSAATGLPILTVDYRLAPEHRFPAGLEDAVTVYRWLLKNGTSPAQIIIAGDSAGGGLAVSMLLSLHENGDELPAAAVLISPMTDLTFSGESLVSRVALDPLISPVGFPGVAKMYLGDHDPRDPLVSPIYADLRDLPPMLIQVGDHEVLLSDSLMLAERARTAGVDVTLAVWPEMWHVWHGWTPDLPEAQQALQQIGDYVTRKLK